MKITKGILAIIAGIITGGMVNIAIIYLSSLFFSVPEGMNLADAESVKEFAGKLTTANYISTIIAHQAGTFVGAFVAYRIAPFRKMIFAFVIGLWFLGCGIYAASLIPAPLWFLIIDLMLYIPVALSAGKASAKKINLRYNEPDINHIGGK